MVGYFRQASRRANAIGAGFIALLALIAAYAGVQLAGTKTGTVLTIGAVLGPVLLVLAITSPVVFPFGLYAFLTPFDALLSFSNAGTLTAALGAASAAAMLFFALRNKRFADPDRSVGLWLLYMLWIVASAFWAIDSSRTFDMLPTALELFGLYVAVSLVRITSKDLSSVLKFTIGGGLAASAYMLYLIHTGVAVHSDRMYLRTDTTFWNPDFLSTALILPLTISLQAAISSRNTFTRIASVVAIAVIVPTMILSGARGPELGALAAFLYLGWRDKNRWKILGCAAAVVCVSAIAFQSSLATRWADALTGGGAGRTNIWHVGWLAFKQNWLFGAGFNNFPQAYNQVYMQVFQPLNVGWSKDSHNILIGNGVELGIIGLILLLLAWYYQFRALSHVGESDERYPVRLALEASLIGLFVSGLFADIMLIKCSWLLFMLINLTRNVRAPATVPAAPQSSQIPQARIVQHA